MDISAISASLLLSFAKRQTLRKRWSELLGRVLDYSTAEPLTEKGGNNFEPSLSTQFMKASMYNVNIFS